MRYSESSSRDDGSILGPNVEHEPAVQIAAGAVITGRVTLLGSSRVGPGVVIEGPRVGSALTIGPDAIVGAGTTVSMASIGARAVLEPGSVVTRTVPPDAVIGGNPGRILRTRLGSPSQAPAAPASPDREGTPDRLIPLRLVDDMRGALVAGEHPRQIPFTVSRFFTVSGVPGPEVRGEHAHLECHQLLVAVAGSLEVICDDGEDTRSYTLDRPDIALYIPPLVWGVQHQYSADAVLLVLASHPYDAADYIRNYDEFIRVVHTRPQADPQRRTAT